MSYKPYQKLKLKIHGMHCASCEVLLERSFKKIEGVEKVRVNHATGEADVYCLREPSVQEFQDSIKESGYVVSGQHEGVALPLNRNTKEEYLQIGAIFFVVIALYLFLKQLDLVPSLGVSENMSYGLVFMIGLVAAVSSCVAVVGGLLLAVAGKYNELHPELSGFQKFKPHIYFNLGRIVSYTIFGGLVGWLGSAITISPKVNGFLIIIVSVVMLLLGFQLLKLFPSLRRFQPKMPKFIAHKIHDISASDSKSAPFVMGGATFFLPCGFTQALQLYVLSTGDVATGALTMMVFSLGTLPALLSLSAVSSFAKGEAQKYFLKFAGVVVILLAISNINNGLNLTGLSSALRVSAASNDFAQIVDGKQIVKMEVSELNYIPANFKVVEGLPVEMQIDGAKAAGCARVLMLPSLGISKYLATDGITTLTFTPKQTGTIPFSCPMGMTTGGAAFNVVPNTTGVVAAAAPVVENSVPYSGEVQKLFMEISAEKGFYPNEFTIKKGIPVELTIDDKVDLGGCMGTMTIPEYNFAQLINLGINTIKFTPTETGVVQATCSMGVLQATFYIID